MRVWIACLDLLVFSFSFSSKTANNIAIITTNNATVVIVVVAVVVCSSTEYILSVEHG